MKVAQNPEKKKEWLCSKGSKGMCYSGTILLKESSDYSRYECIFNSPKCTFVLCESCGLIYMKGKDIVDILHVKRPPNKKLWSVFFESDTQKAIPFEKCEQNYKWPQGYYSKDINA
jgi:hypothetical protein